MGSADEALPCHATSGDLPRQDLTDPVAETRQLLFDLASTRDYKALAALARTHRTHMPVEDAIGPDPARGEDALVRSWVADGVAKVDPLGSLAAVLQAEPPYAEDIQDWPVYMAQGTPMTHDPNPDPEGCMWVWSNT